MEASSTKISDIIFYATKTCEYFPSKKNKKENLWDEDQKNLLMNEIGFSHSFDFMSKCHLN